MHQKSDIRDIHLAVEYVYPLSIKTM